MAGQPTALIVNTRSRKGRHLFREARRELLRAGVNLVAFYPAKSGRRLRRAVDAAIAKGIKVVVIGGGDGTVASVANALAHRQVVLGVLPLGTGNDFARTLGIPIELADACRVVAGGYYEPIDLGQVNGRYFVNTTIIGFPAYLNHNVPNWLKGIAGRVAYALMAVYAIFSVRPFRATITVDGVQQELETSMILLGNGRFHVPAQGHPPAGPEDRGRLILQAPRDIRRLTLIRLAFQFSRLGWLSPKHLMALSGSEVVIETEPPQPLDIDGEGGGTTPITATIASSALLVLRPRPGEAGLPQPEPGLAA